VSELRYALFGRSGLRVSELALGTMTFGTDWGWGADADECGRIFRRFAEAGGNFIDTANNYTDGSSEEIVGSLVEGKRDRFVLATKYSLTIDRADPNAGGNHRKSLVRSLEQSLRRLRTDYVDLLWLHMRDASDAMPERVERVLRAVRKIAEPRGCTMSQVAIAWLLGRSAPVLVPVVGVRNEAQLADNLGAATSC
jgi:aryl-alcohol dehydrogenase-like predicted oxidoreductase